MFFVPKLFYFHCIHYLWMDLFTIFNGADKALQTFRFQGEVDGIPSKVGKYPPLKLIKSCLLASDH